MSNLKGFVAILFGSVIGVLVWLTGLQLTPLIAGILWGPQNAGAELIYLLFIILADVAGFAVGVRAYYDNNPYASLAAVGLSFVFTFLLGTLYPHFSVILLIAGVALISAGFVQLREGDTTS